MSEILAIIALIVFIITAKRNLVWALGLVIFLLPSYLWRLDFFGLPSTFLELMIVTLFILWLVKNKLFSRINWRLLKKSSNPLPKAWRYLLSLWLVVSLIALAVNFDLAALGLWRAYFLEPLFFFLVFIYTVKNQQDRNLIMYAMGGLVIWLAAIAIWQDFTAWNLPAAYDLPNARRLTAVFSYPNALSLLIAPITAWFAGLWLVSKNKTKHLAFLGVIFLGFLLLILAKSEGAILALVVSLLIYIFTVRLPRFFKPSLLIIALVVILLTPMKGYLQSMPRQILDPHPQPPVTSLEIRGHQWSETGDLLADHWLVGAGINGYQKMMAAYHHLPWLEIYLYPHNIFLNFWVELGLFGLLLFVFILIYLFKTCYILLKSKHQLAWPIILAWTTWLVHGLVDVPYFKNDLSILFFVLLAWTILSARDNRASSIVK